MSFGSHCLHSCTTDSNCQQPATSPRYRGRVEPTDLPLRERKRLKAMRRIQTVAIDLFERDGFEAVTIERIAGEADVSPSSIYRWFGTKEKLVIWDEYDPQALTAIRDALEGAPPLEAVRHVIETIVQAAIDEDEQRIRRRMRLAFSTPSIEAASTLQAYEMAELIIQVLATKLNVDPRNLQIRVTAHALVGGILGALRTWYDSDFTLPVTEVISAPLDLLERGVQLD